MPTTDRSSAQASAAPPAAGGPPRRGARSLRIALATLAVLLLAAVAGGAVVVVGGVYDISATAQHTRPVYTLLEVTMKYAVQRRAAGIAVPPLNDAKQRAHGQQLFDRHCSNCHGAPGQAPEAYAQLLQPLPGPLTRAASQWRPQELYWIARHGVKMSGMPGWEGRLDDAELWAIVAFLQQLPQLSPDDYRQQAAAARAVRVVAAVPAALGEDSAVAALRRYGCHGCHVIPGIVGPTVVIGPPLERFGTRTLIAGRWANTEDNLVEWLRRPQAMDPRSAMPDLGVSPSDATLIARHLRSMR